MTRRRWEQLKAYIERIAREPKELRDAQRAAECAEWCIAADVVPTSGEAKVAVAMLIGSMHLAWHNGRNW